MTNPTFEERLEEMRQQLGLVTVTLAKHEQELERLRRTMRAALEVWLGGNGDEGEVQQ